VVLFSSAKHAGRRRGVLPPHVPPSWRNRFLNPGEGRHPRREGQGHLVAQFGVRKLGLGTKPRTSTSIGNGPVQPDKRIKPKLRLEPAHLAALEPKSSVSAIPPPEQNL